MTEQIGAVIAAAGSSSRMGGTDKLTALLGGEPVLARTIRAVAAVPEVTEIVVVTRADRIEAVRELAAGIPKVRQVVAGGATRQESVLAGVRALSGDCRLAAIHDGARPLVTREVFSRCIKAALEHGAATAAVPVKDTIKRAAPDGRVADTPDRSQLWAVQTPQVFDRARYLEAAGEALAEGCDFTDDCQLFEHKGWPVWLVRGDYRNLKLTTPEDFLAAGAYLEGLE